MYTTIENLCKNHGITISKLCKEISIPRSTLTELKTGRTKALSSNNIYKISSFFGISADDLINGRIEKKSTVSKENELKVALFGGDTDITDDMWDEVKRYARFIKEQRGK